MPVVGLPCVVRPIYGGQAKAFGFLHTREQVWPAAAQALASMNKLGGVCDEPIRGSCHKHLVGGTHQVV
jgi:hypothetical protein